MDSAKFIFTMNNRYLPRNKHPIISTRRICFWTSALIRSYICRQATVGGTCREINFPMRPYNWRLSAKGKLIDYYLTRVVLQIWFASLRNAWDIFFHLRTLSLIRIWPGIIAKVLALSKTHVNSFLAISDNSSLCSFDVFFMYVHYIW